MSLTRALLLALTPTLFLWVAAPPPASAQQAAGLQAQPAHQAREHHLIIQVNSDDVATMNLALNNAQNAERYYESNGETVQIEVVAFGPGLHMLRGDTSPVKQRIQVMAQQSPSISFKACANTRESMSRSEQKPVPLLSQAQLVKSGVIRIIELQEKGWSYLRP